MDQSKGGLLQVIGAYEAKIRLSELLDRVQKTKESLCITKKGTAVAWLVPCPLELKTDPASAVEAIKHFRKNKKLKGLKLHDMIAEGRRF